MIGKYVAEVPVAESFCVLDFKMIKSGAVNDELASNVYVEV